MASTLNTPLSTPPDFAAHRAKSGEEKNLKSQMYLKTDCEQNWDDSMSQSPVLGHQMEEDSPYLDSARLGGMSGMSPFQSGSFDSLRLDRHGSEEFTLPSSHAAEEDMYKLHGELALTTRVRSYTGTALGLIESTSSDEQDQDDDELMPLREAQLRVFAQDAGLADESRFLSHWFGLQSTSEDTNLSEALPRPSPWNHFVDEIADIEATPTKSGFGLRAFAMDSGLAEDSKFLSHWFGLTGPSSAQALDDTLPRPSTWNYFAPAEGPMTVTPEEKTGFGLRAFAMDAGLAEDSKFLSHWFGLTGNDSSLEDQLPRPSPWNYFAPEARGVPQKTQTRSHMLPRERELRTWAADAGLSQDSAFLSHWFGLTDGSATLQGQLPRPSTWNYFSYGQAEVVAPEAKSGFGLRAFAMDAGLAEDSKFLSHWFGLTDHSESTLDDALPRPCPWNHFAPAAAPAVVKQADVCGCELRAWAFDAGLAEDSKFLSHWFGLTDTSASLEDQLPRPSAWNYFAPSKAAPGQQAKSGFGLRAWAMDAGLHEESQFLSHWFGLQQKSTTAYTELMGPAMRSTLVMDGRVPRPWVY